jgi:ABC-type dipeptide/oligopeptide/nickel transport system permease component
MGVATIAGFLNLIGLLMADISYAIADPRISFESAE